MRIINFFSSGLWESNNGAEYLLNPVSGKGKYDSWLDHLEKRVVAAQSLRRILQF